MHRPSYVVAVLVLVLAVVGGGSFALLDFGVTRSVTDSEQTVSTASAGGATVDLSGGVAVYVVGDTVADREFEAAIVDDLRARGVDAVAVAELRETNDRPVLVVAHREWRLGYTPVHGDATVAWRSLYVQSGDLSQFGRSAPDVDDFTTARLAERLVGDDVLPVVLEDADLVSQGSFAVTDETTGVLSLPHYDRHVRTVVAAATVDALPGETD